MENPKTKNVFLRLPKYFLIIIAVSIVLLFLLGAESLFFSFLGFEAVLLVIFCISVILIFAVKFFFKSFRANTEFISMISHKLKTSLTASKWSLKMFLDGDFGSLTNEQKDVISRLYKKNDFMIYTIGDLLNLEKLESGSFVFDKKPLDMQGIIQSVINDYQDAIKDKNIKVNFKKPEEGVPQLMLDRSSMESAIQNLFDNAIKYTKPAGIITVFLESDKDSVEIKIQDSGIGIPKNQQSNIFGKFFRCNNAIKLEKDGTGLGLFITKRIIEDHNGKIWFESEEGKGSSFYISLPLSNSKKSIQ